MNRGTPTALPQGMDNPSAPAMADRPELIRDILTRHLPRNESAQCPDGLYETKCRGCGVVLIRDEGDLAAQRRTGLRTIQGHGHHDRIEAAALQHRIDLLDALMASQPTRQAACPAPEADHESLIAHSLQLHVLTSTKMPSGLPLASCTCNEIHDPTRDTRLTHVWHQAGAAARALRNGVAD